MSSPATRCSGCSWAYGAMGGTLPRSVSDLRLDYGGASAWQGVLVRKSSHLIRPQGDADDESTAQGYFFGTPARFQCGTASRTRTCLLYTSPSPRDRQQ